MWKRYGFFFCVLFYIGTFTALGSEPVPEIEDMEMLLKKGEELLSKNGTEKLLEIDSLLGRYKDFGNKKTQIRYYLFKGGLAQKLRHMEVSKSYYDQAFLLTENDDSGNKAIACFGLSRYYHYKNDNKRYKEYMEKSLRYAKIAKDTFWMLQSALGLARLYDLQKDFGKTREYLSIGIGIDSTNSSVRMRRADLYFRNQRFREGMEDVWEVVLADEHFEREVTMYALFRVIETHIKMGSYEKAREIIAIVLDHPEKYDPKIIAYYTMYQGLLEKEQGFSTKALESFKKALHLYKERALHINILTQMFPLDKANWYKGYVTDMVDSGVLVQEVLGTDIACAIHIVLQSHKSGRVEKRQAIDNAFAFLNKHPEALLSVKSLLWELVQENTKNLSYRNEAFEQRLQQFHETQKTEKQAMVETYVYVNNKVFGKRLHESKQLIHEKEGIIAQEKKANTIFYWVIAVMIIVLLVISSLLIKIFLDHRKIRKLNEAVLAKNKSLEHYGREYEHLLMILSHQVKKPINQLHYSLSELIERTKPLDDAHLDFILSTITDHSAELSSRVKMILTLIKNSLDQREIATTRIHLYQLIQDRLKFFEPHFKQLNVRFDFKVNKRLYVENNIESLSIILDNLFENIKKYGVSEDVIAIGALETDEGVLLEIRNAFSEKLQSQLIQRPSSRKSIPSFGLGNTIIKNLCERLQIKFEFIRSNQKYATRLLFTGETSY